MLTTSFVHVDRSKKCAKRNGNISREIVLMKTGDLLISNLVVLFISRYVFQHQTRIVDISFMTTSIVHDDDVNIIKNIQSKTFI